MTNYLEQLEQLERLWAQPAFDPFPEIWATSHGEKPLSFNPVVGAQKDHTLIPAVSSVWKPLTLSPHHTDNDSCDSPSLSSAVSSSAVSSSASLLATDQKDLNHQSSRNILITNIPQHSYHLVVHSINTFANIKDIREQSDGDCVKMAVAFYDLQHVSNAYTALIQFLHTRLEFRHVVLDVCSDLVVNSTFGLSWRGLLSVTLSGNLWNLRVLDYKHVLETYGTLRYHKQPVFSENGISLIVEYSDTCAAVAAQKALDGLSIQNVTFHAYLSKPNIGRTQSFANRAQSPVSSEYPELASKGLHKASLLLSAWTPQQDIDDIFSLAPNPGTLHYSGTPAASSFLPSTTPQQKRWSPIRQMPLSKVSAPISRFMCVNQPPATLRPTSTSGFINPAIKDNFSLPSCTSADRRIFGHRGFSALDGTLNKPLLLESKVPTPSTLFPCNKCNLIPGKTTSTNKEMSPAAPVTTATTMPMIPRAPSSFSAPSKPPKTQQAVGRSQHASQHRNVFDVNRIISGQDSRTTFMIRNIPNKYNQVMLAECIDATHKGTYDFLYLRIDFQNKCNVGYAFINFMNPQSAVSFASQRAGKQWNRFHSEKVCELAYANIQGKFNLIQKFRNSTVMSHDVTYRPKIYYSSGIHQGEEEPFPGPDYARSVTKVQD